MNIFHRNSIRLIKKYEKNWLKYLSEPLPLINNRDKYIKYFINKEEDSEICLIKWFPRTETDIHLHPIRGCSYKLLYGSLKETVYHPISNMYRYEMVPNKNYVRYIDNEIGSHKIENLSNKFSFSLHVYPYDKYNNIII